MSKSKRRWGRLAERVPGLKRLPVVRLLMIGEVAVLAREHVERLSPAERRRLVELIKEARLRPSTLPARERDELEQLIHKAEPRLFAAAAADKLSPVPLPGPVKNRIVGEDRYGISGRLRDG